jgi:DNA polymerase-3 subunit alpha
VSPPDAPDLPLVHGGATAYDMGDLEKLGYIKFDILGLKTLSVLAPFVEKYGLPNPLIWTKPVQDLLHSGKTNGVFQLDGTGISDYTKRYKPTSITDVSDILALYRPGPMGQRDKPETQTTEKMITIRNNSFLRRSDVLIYQEQVMQIARDVAEYTMSEADSLRKAIGKKNIAELNKHEANFPSDLWQKIKTFGQYAFNKAHSMCYAYLAYYTAYFKETYPLEFSLHNIRVYKDSPEDRIKAIMAAKYHHGIKILPPLGYDHWETVIEGDAIRLGMELVRGCNKKPKKPGKIVKDAMAELEKNTILGQIHYLGVILLEIKIKPAYYVAVFAEKKTAKNSGNDYWRVVGDSGNDYVETVLFEEPEIGQLYQVKR